MINLNHAVKFQHVLWQDVLPKAKCIVDATVGNGHDFFYLAEHCASGTTLFGFDIQSAAIQATQGRMKECMRTDISWHLSLGDHATLLGPDTDVLQPIDLLIFNLGYLPSGNHQCMTTSRSTIGALQGALPLLSDKGMVTIVAYPGTPEGLVEENDVAAYLASLPQKEYDVSTWKPLNQRNNPPTLYIVKRR